MSLQSMFRGAAITVVSIVLASASVAAPSEAKGIVTVISGGDLPHPVAMSFEDSFAFLIPSSTPTNMDGALYEGFPTKLESPPAGLGAGYQLGGSGPWYDLIAEAEGSTEIGEIEVTYYPAVRAARLDVESQAEPVWVGLDEQRAELLDRYISLGRAGLLSEAPSVLDVLAAEWTRTSGLTAIEVGGRSLEPGQLVSVWAIVASERWPEVQVSLTPDGARLYTGSQADFDDWVTAVVQGVADDIELTLLLEDGRDIELHYYPRTGAIAGLPLPYAARSGRGFVVPPAVAEDFAAALGVSRTPVSTAPAPPLAVGAPTAGESAPISLATAGLVALSVLAVVATGTAIARSARSIRV